MAQAHLFAAFFLLGRADSLRINFEVCVREKFDVM